MQTIIRSGIRRLLFGACHRPIFEMILVLIMIIAMLAGLLFEVARPDMVIFSVLVILLLTGTVTPDEALSGFSNQGMLTIALLFIVAGGRAKKRTV